MKRLVVLLLAAAVPTGAALANPIAVDVLRVRQVPTTRHVQITYGHDGSVGGTVPVPTTVERDGAKVDLVWVPMSGSFTANTGSGLIGVDATQTCDCDVPLGAHTYTVTLDGTTPMGGSVTVSEASAVPVEVDAGPTDDDADAGDSDVEVYPWEIPEPTALQGLDCAVVCAGSVVEPVVEDEPDVIDANTSEEDTAGADATVVPGSTDTDGDVEGGGGCAAGGGSAAATLLALGALLALAVLRRKRA
ncbi:MAG: hypothetical protein EP329_10030 [Deltaproteobacteria bacterium]|nr:MAG: hypothetical protein EP329_10030 [Deltaproteobacteria bacterium]